MKKILLSLFISITLLSVNAQAETIIIETSKGQITISLDSEKAPGTVNNFLQYVKNGFYEGTIFHRVIKGFMIQAGGFDEKMSQKLTNDPIKKFTPLLWLEQMIRTQQLLSFSLIYPIITSWTMELATVYLVK
jgi:hypothetical protein